MSVWFALLVSILNLSCEAYQVVNESTKVFWFSFSNGNDTLCLQDHPDTPCQSLKMAAQILSTYKNNIRLEIEEDCSLTEVLQVQNDSSFITIAGVLGNSGNFPTIECMGNAGINVTGTHNFSITKLSFKKCSVQGDHVFPYSSTVVIANSQDISLINVTISHSPNTATYFINCMGTVLLNYVVMEYNGHTVHGMYDGVYSGGLCIEQTGTDEPIGEGVYYNISHCVFKFNKAHKAPYDHDNNHTSRDHIGYGGAVYVYFRRTARNSTLVIEFSDFVENIGRRGGGMYIDFGDKACNNEVYIHRCNFSNNTARYSGGGLAIDYSAYSSENLVNIIFCNFTRNCAEFGGGLVILPEHGKRSSGNSIVASKCTWSDNYGTLSSAIDIAPKYPDQDRTDFLPEVTFLDCTISNNKLGYFCKELDSVHQNFHSPRVYHISSGVVLVTRFRVSFGGNTLFYKNDYSALVVVSATVTFKNDSCIVFDENIGYNGGAVGLYGFSQITLSRDLVLKFVNNHALNHGGAIVYYTIDQHSLTSSKNCFFRHQDLGNKSLVQTTHVIFENNTAEVAGNSIYSESFTDCYYQCLNSGDHKDSTYYKYYEYLDITNCLGNFSIPYHHPQLVSGGRFFKFNDTTTYNFSVIPGDQVDVPFKVVDDFNQTVTPMMSVNRANSACSDVMVDQIYTLNTNITPTGEPGRSSNFTFSVLGLRHIYFNFSITLLPCPPGFYFDNMSKVCKCGNGDNGYEDIIRCSTFRAKPKSGLWLGYIPQNMTDTDFRDLYFAPCPGPICSSGSFRSLTDDSNDSNLLPKHADDLNSNICDKNRAGILCGRCANKSSTYYHSKKFECKHSQLCYLGWLFYILAEVLPLVIFFVVVITFDFSFTSGRAVGFIFFAQHLDKLTIHINKYFTYLRTPYRVFYGLFNLEFFETESLSFCPWYSSQVLDVIALKYVTIILALGLVFLLITLLHNNCCSCICRLRWKVRARTSIVHGLCAFLVICYAQSSKTAFYILKYSIPSGYNGTTSTWYSYYGGLKYLQGDHLVYAIPSFISVVFLTVLPPLVLLFYPLSLQLLSACRLSEHKFVLKLLQVLRIHKLVLFIDCFQSCYMDRHRYFAGLYFVYGIIILICYSINPHGYKFYVYSQIFFIIFLGIHCIIQPYKERLHNILDSLVFFNLCLINASVLVSEQIPYLSHALLLVSSVQLVLIYMPMAVLFGWFSVKSYRHFKNMWLRKKLNLEVAVNDVVDYNRSLSEDDMFKSHSIGSYGSIRS